MLPHRSYGAAALGMSALLVLSRNCSICDLWNAAATSSRVHLSLADSPSTCGSFARPPDASIRRDVFTAAHPVPSTKFTQCRSDAVSNRMTCGEHGCVKGTCFFNKCWCFPGFSGERCDIQLEKQPLPCPDWKEWYDLVKTCEQPVNECNGNVNFVLGTIVTNRLKNHNGGHVDECFTNPSFGAALIPMQRWYVAQAAEAVLWKQMGGATGQCDRCDEHAAFFDKYSTLQKLGNVAEFGCGPYTQLGTMLKSRPDLKPTVESITLADPGMDGYLKLDNCAYKDGTLLGLPVFPYTCGAEEFPFVEAFDTLVMLNVIEHAWDAFSVLTSAYAAIKPGGVFIFHERLLDLSLQSEAYHPIRLKMNIFDNFLLRGFDTMFNKTQYLPGDWLYPEGTRSVLYYVGRKKMH